MPVDARYSMDLTRFYLNNGKIKSQIPGVPLRR